MEHFYSRKLSYHCLLSLFGHPQCSTLFSKTIYATNCCSISLRSFSENFQLSFKLTKLWGGLRRISSWYANRFCPYTPKWSTLNLTFILNKYQSFRSNHSLISGVLPKHMNPPSLSSSLFINRFSLLPFICQVNWYFKRNDFDQKVLVLSQWAFSFITASSIYFF